MTDYRGIDYTLPGSTVNRDPDTGIRFGVISIRRLHEFIWDNVEPVYPGEVGVQCPKCKLEFTTTDTCGDDTQVCPECGEEFEDPCLYELEPIGYEMTGEPEYQTRGPDECNDFFVLKSPYKTRARLCSPCAPGACHLENPCPTGAWAYCFGPGMFDNNQPPYPVYRVDTGELVHPGPNPDAED